MEKEREWKEVTDDLHRMHRIFGTVEFDDNGTWRGTNVVNVYSVRHLF